MKADKPQSDFRGLFRIERGVLGRMVWYLVYPAGLEQNSKEFTA